MTRPGRPILGSTAEPLEVPVMTRVTKTMAARARATLGERETMADFTREAIGREVERREALLPEEAPDAT